MIEITIILLLFATNVDSSSTLRQRRLSVNDSDINNRRLEYGNLYPEDFASACNKKIKSGDLNKFLKIFPWAQKKYRETIKNIDTIKLNKVIYKIFDSK